MTINLEVFRAQVDGVLVANDDELSQLRRDRFIKAAIERYSHDAPDIITEDVAGDGGNYYGLAASLTSWVEGFARIVRIEYPAPTVASDEAPVYLESDEWDDDYWDGTTRYLFLPAIAPAATEAMRIRYTAPYIWAASSITEAVEQTAHGYSADNYVFKDNLTWHLATDARIATHQISAVADADNFTVKILEVDVPVEDFFAICHLAAGYCAQAISDRYSRTSDSSIAVDSVDHISRADQWSRRARELFALYEKHLGLDQDSSGLFVHAAGEFVDWDTAPDWPYSKRWLMHGNR